MRAFLRYLAAAALIVAGAWLIHLGHRRAFSAAGVVEKTRKDIANVFDGRDRRPGYVYDYAGGGILILGGAWFALRARHG